MKRKISLMLAVLMICNLFTGMLSVHAESIPEENYEFMDTAYDPNTGTYVVIAKDFTKNANGNPLPVRVYKSQDGVDWTYTFKSSNDSYLNSNKLSRQSLIWWEDAKSFALMTGDNVYFSPDGETWSPKKIDNNNQGIFRGNAMIASEGDSMILSGGRAAKFANLDNLNDSQVDHHIFDPANSNTTTIAVGMTPKDADGNRTYVAVSSGTFWFFPGTYPEGSNSNLDNVTKLGNGFGPNQYAYDMIYEGNSNTWMLVNGTENLHVLSPEKEYNQITVADSNNITAVGASQDLILVGKQNGELYYAEAFNGATADTIWNPVAAGSGNMDDEVRSITPTKDGEFLIVTKSKIYLASMTDEGLTYYDITAADIKMEQGETKILVPAGGSEAYDYTFGVYDFRGMPSADTVASVELAQPHAGVSVSGTELTVASEAAAGDIILHVTTVSGETKDFTVELVREASVTIEGRDSIAIPSTGSVTENYTTTIVGTDNEVLDARTAVITVEGTLPQGITFANDTLTVSADAQTAAVTLKAVSNADPSITATKQVAIKERSPETVVITGEDAITVNGGESRHQYTAKVVDQADIEMPDKTVVWSVSNADNSVEISQDGMLTLYGVTESTELTVRATCKEFPEVYGEKKITVTYTAAGADDVDVVPSEKYEFIDTVYSPDLGVYIAIGKGLENTSSHGAEIYRSEDAVKWKKVLTVENGTNSANPFSRQVVVWWEKEQTFVAAFAGSIYASKDGLEWTYKANLSVASNLNLSTNGQKLLIGSEKSVYIANTIDGEPVKETFSTDSYSSVVAGLDNQEVTRYIATGHYVTWSKTGDGTFAKAYPNLEGNPTEIQYSESLDRWLLVNKKDKVRVLNFPASVGAFSVKLSDGKTNAEGFSAVCAGTDTNILGTVKGSLYAYENEGKLINAETVWSVVEPAEGTEAIEEEIRSICQVDTGMYMVASVKKMYMMIKKDGAWKYYQLVEDSMVLPEDQIRLEIPFSGSTQVIYQPQAIDYKGDPSDNQAISFVPVSEIPEGVTFDFGGNYNGVSRLTIDSTVSPDATLTMKAVFADGAVSQCTLSFVKEKDIKLTVNDQLPLPTNETGESWDVSVAILGTDGQPMKRTATVVMESQLEGVVFDTEAMKLYIAPNAQAGDIVLKAHSDNDKNINTTQVIPLSKVYIRNIKIVTTDEALTIPDDPNVRYQYRAEAYDQAGRLIKNADVAWSVAGAAGVAIDSLGRLQIPTTLYDSTIDITVASAENPAVKDTKEVTLTISDYRHTVEDAKELQLDLSNVTDNVVLPAEGNWGSTIKWLTSDPTVITADGVITRNPKKDTTATLTATIVYTNKQTENSEKSEKTFKVTVKRADNIFANGDVELGDTTGFISDYEMQVVEDDVRGGKYALKVNGDSVSVAGNKLESNSSYYYEAYVKAPAGSEITLVSGKYGTLNTAEAQNGYTKITGFINASKALEDVLTIKVNGADEFLVDDVKYADITEVYDALVRAIATAESTKKQADYDKAAALLDDFYDVPEKDKLRERLEKIKIDDGNDNSKPRPNTGGGSGSGSRPGSNVAPIVTIPNNQDQQDEVVSDYLLIFKDLKNHWAKDDVEYMAEKGIVSGREEGVFDPEASITRAEFAVLITKTMGLGEVPYENMFFDIVEDDWYSGFVQSARNAGYVVGSDGLYRPNDKITREEIAKIVVSAYAQKTGTQIETGGALYYNDLSDISVWAYDYIVNAVNLGFVNGISEYSFAPKATATRAQAAVMLKRLLDKLPQ